MKRILSCLLFVLCVSSMACASLRGTVATTPTPAETQSVRALAVRIADGTTAVLEIANQTGVLVNSLPLDVATKDKYDCTVLKVIGTNTAPSPTVTKVCGPVPTKETAPLAIGLAKLKSVGSCPSLKTTTAEILSALSPLLTALSTSTNSSLKFAAASLSAAFSFAQQFLSGGVPCGSV